MNARSFIMILVALGLFLPLGVCVFIGVEALLGAMGDAAGQIVVQRIRLGGLILWGVDLVLLVILLGIQQISQPSGSTKDSVDEK